MLRGARLVIQPLVYGCADFLYFDGRRRYALFEARRTPDADRVRTHRGNRQAIERIEHDIGRDVTSTRNQENTTDRCRRYLTRRTLAWR